MSKMQLINKNTLVKFKKNKQTGETFKEETIVKKYRDNQNESFSAMLILKGDQATLERFGQEIVVNYDQAAVLYEKVAGDGQS